MWRTKRKSGPASLGRGGISGGQESLWRERLQAPEGLETDDADDGGGGSGGEEEKGGNDTDCRDGIY